MFLNDIKFSLWCDFIERSFLENEFKDLITQKIVNGATSNPAIFKNAILTSQSYKEDIEKLKNKNPKEIYEELACKDIKKAAEILYPLYEKGDDGFISIEIDPRLCDNAQESIKEGKRLFEKIGKRNVMIKVPATQAGYEIIETLIGEGINVNITLVFSPLQAQLSLQAIKKGKQKLKADKKSPQVVISVFVSRFDRKLDKKLLEKNIKPSLTGILNAGKIYNMIEGENIANVRTLFASTGVKDNRLESDYYIDKLLFAHSINTAPLNTIKYFIKNKKFTPKNPINNQIIDEYFEKLSIQGIDMEEIYSELIREGLEAFKNAFNEILKQLGE